LKFQTGALSVHLKIRIFEGKITANIILGNIDNEVIFKKAFAKQRIMPNHV
jgi:hypothetical protein